MQVKFSIALLMASAAVTSSAFAADNVGASITGTVSPSACNLELSTHTLDFGDISYDDVKSIDAARESEPSSTGLRVSGFSKSASPITITYNCGVDTSITAVFEDAIASNADDHSANNIFGSEVTNGFTMRDSDNNAIGIVRFGSSDALPSTDNLGNEGTSTSLRNFNKASSSSTQGSKMGPIAMVADTDEVWTLEPLLYLNVNALDPSKEVAITGTVDMRLEF
ncbi:hypothetical protein KI743_22140 [Vibrio sp. D420a]|uniref:hypothetical protein n=1 Tax=Vibrio sp. D420a TaxID=2836895 RepID=UPI002555DA08|nr:hypothetical protein [Vibrio sp. D420a]MDK9764707.1 hypothetical protein [Vibrio sp. D420a]